MDRGAGPRLGRSCSPLPAPHGVRHRVQAEVESWGDSPKGLYVEGQYEANFQPACTHSPLQETEADPPASQRPRLRMASHNPYVTGIGIEAELCVSRVRPLRPGGTCYCDYCLGGFLRKQKGPRRRR